jgi:hypothetical protein
MFVNWKLRELNLKVVYYGPALSGKTTNLQYIYQKTNPNARGDLVSLKTRGDRTIYFDFLQLEMKPIAGLKPRFNLYTVPGQVYYAGTRKLVLQGADGVVFVADSQLHRLGANLEARRDMVKNLTALGLRPERTPVVLQCNKQDLPSATPASLLQQQLNMESLPAFGACALEGQGIFNTLKTIINAVVARAQREL